MVGVSRLLVALAVASFLSQPLYADVIPTRRAADTTESTKKVESRLVQLGVDANAAKEQVKSLTDDQTKYFAAETDRVKLLGQGENWGGQSDNLWWEWVFGILALGAVAAFIVIEVGK
jgi:hypothetical protein